LDEQADDSADDPADDPVDEQADEQVEDQADNPADEQAEEPADGQADDLAVLATEQFCYLTTTGRKSGRPHTIEIWFAGRGATLYVLSGGGERSDWVRNLRHDPAVSVRIGRRDRRERAGRARVVEAGSPEDGLARRLLFDKYQPGYGGDLAGWRDASLPVAVDLDERAGHVAGAACGVKPSLQHRGVRAAHGGHPSPANRAT
jgi:deazaflavin-dependent oxidoreductase (nitroreductase family)